MIASPRISTGSCRPYRIKTEYKEGSGDTGISNVSVSKRDTKSDPILKIHPSVEQLRNNLSLLFESHSLYCDWDLIDGHVLQWFRDNTFSISSYLHLQGNTTDHRFPQEFMDYMESCIARDKEDIGPAPDFLIWDHELLVRLDEVRVLTRVLETKIFEVSLLTDVAHLLPILNRFSTYIFWLQRRVAKELGIKEKYWKGKVTEFPLSVNNLDK